MPQINRKIIVIIILIFTFLFSNVEFKERTASNYSIAKRFPNVINEWTGQNVQLKKNDFVFSIIPPNDLVFRYYKKHNIKDEINLALILADDKKTIHDPQICYVLQGFKFIDKKNIELASNLNVSCLKAKKSNETFSFIYWYTDLDYNYATRKEFWLSIILKKLFNKPVNTYGIVILYTPTKNENNLKLFAKKINNILFAEIKKDIY